MWKVSEHSAGTQQFNACYLLESVFLPPLIQYQLKKCIQNTILQAGTGEQLENRSYGAYICLLKNLQALNIDSLEPEVTSVSYLSHSLHFSDKESLLKCLKGLPVLSDKLYASNESNTLDTLIQFRDPLSYGHLSFLFFFLCL